MTIKEFIEANEGKHVKIGFSKGFIYCDKIEHDRTIKEIEEASIGYIKDANETINNLKADIIRLSSNEWAEKKKEQFKKKVEMLSKRVSNFEEKRNNKAQKLKELQNELTRLIAKKELLEKMDDDKIDSLALKKRYISINSNNRKILTIKEKIKKLQNTDFNELLEKSKKNFKNECDEIKFNQELEREAKSKIRLIKQKKEQITAIRRSIKDFIPYLDVESSNIYMGVDGDTVIFTSKQNNFIVGKFWDETEYHNRYLKREMHGENTEEDSVDLLLAFFASEYGKLMMGKIHPEFIIEQLLNAELYLVY